METSFSLSRRRAVFLVASLGYILSQFYRSFLTVIVDDLARDLGVGPKELGEMGSAWFFVFALAQFPVGVLLDRFGPRRTIAGMMSFAVIGALMFAQASSVMLAIIAMALIGLGCAPILMGALYFFARTETPVRFAALGSLFLGVGLSGGLIAATPLALFVTAFGWRASLLWIAGVTVLAAILIALVMRDPPQEQAASGGSMFGALADLLRLPTLWPSLIMSIFITAEVWTERALWVGPFFGEVHGLSSVERGHAILAFAIAMTLCALLAGPIAARINHPKLVALVGTAASGLAFLALALVPASSPFLALVLICLVGLFGATYAVQIAHTRQFMPAHVIGRGITFVNFLSIGGTGVVQYLSGSAMAQMKAVGMAPEARFAVLHATFGIIMLLSALVFTLAPKKPEMK